MAVAFFAIRALKFVERQGAEKSIGISAGVFRER